MIREKDIDKIKAYIWGDASELSKRAEKRYQLIKTAHKYNKAFAQNREKVIKMLVLERDYEGTEINERTAREIIREAQEIFGELEIFEREYQIQIAYGKLLEAAEIVLAAGDMKTYGSLTVKINEFAHKLPKAKKQQKKLPYLVMTNNPLVFGFKPKTLPNMKKDILALAKGFVSPTILKEIEELAFRTGETLDADFEILENE